MSSYLATVCRLRQENKINNFSSCTKRHPPSESIIKKSLAYANNARRRNLWSKTLVNNPYIRFAILNNEDNKIKIIRHPCLIETENNEGDTVLVMVGLLGDDTLQYNFVHFPPTTFSRVTLGLISDANAGNMGIEPANLNVHQLHKKSNFAETITNKEIFWQDDDYPQGARAAILPTACPLPPTAKGHHGASILEPIPDNDDDEWTPSYYRAWLNAQRHLATNFEGKSLHSPDHPTLSQQDWDGESALGNETYQATRPNLTPDIYCEYNMIKASALDSHDAKEIIDDLMICSVALEASTLQTNTTNDNDQTEQVTEDTTNQVNASSAFNMESLAQTIGATFAKENRKSKDGAAESKRQQNITDAKDGYRLMLGKVENDTVVPAETTKTFKKILGLADVNIAQKHFVGGIKEVVQQMKDCQQVIGYFAKFNRDTVTNSLVKCLQQGEWHYQQMVDVHNTINHKLSVLIFLPCRNDNGSLVLLLQSKVMKALDDLHGEVDNKRKSKAKLLFIMGEQDSKEAVVALCCNLLAFINLAIKEPHKALLYKCIHKYLSILLSKDGSNLFDRHLKRTPHLPHCIVNNLHHIVTAHCTVTMRKVALLQKI